MRTLLERFEDKIFYSPDGCWYWTGAINVNGYGLLRIATNKYKLAHRISYEIHKGVPRLRCICHTCDNPLCVNPDHLFDGTQSDNMIDMTKKGRRYTPKLNPDLVLEIMSFRGKLPGKIVAEIYSIHMNYLYRLWRHEFWKQLIF